MAHDDPRSLLATIVATLLQMPAGERARAAGEIIAAVQGEGDRRITRMRWAAIAEMHEQGMAVEDIAAELATSAGAIDLALQSHRRYATTSASAPRSA